MSKLVVLQGTDRDKALRAQIMDDLVTTAEMVRDMKGRPTALGLVVIISDGGRQTAFHLHAGPDKLALNGGLVALGRVVDKSMETIAVEDGAPGEDE